MNLSYNPIMKNTHNGRMGKLYLAIVPKLKVVNPIIPENKKQKIK